MSCPECFNNHIQTWPKSSTGNREVVKYLRNNHPEITLQEIGSHVGISRERVRQLLSSEKLETRSSGRQPVPMPNCQYCGTSLPHRRRRYCGPKCQYPNGKVTTYCHYCNKEIILMTSVYNSRQFRSKYIHCSRYCRDNSRRGQTNERYNNE